MSAHGAGWPLQSDYIVALQDPSTAFRDAALRKLAIECDAVLGLPRPRSGHLAGVYKAFDGRAAWALRCFTFDAPERAARYAQIGAYLARHPNPYTVDFTYLDDGIEVDNRMFPLVKMPWIEGDLLGSYIVRHRAAPAVLERLAAAWIELVRDLHELGIAHGDLQHGNVIVTAAGVLRLIDYDGMFVPALSGCRSSESGHPNYQHPCRRATDFDAQLDNFSAWIVYLAIVMVAREPATWAQLGCDDECLGLRHADFVRPSQSSAFGQLEAAGDAGVRHLARFVRSLLSHEPLRLPALEDRARAVLAGASPLASGAFVEPFEKPPEPPLTPKHSERRRSPIFKRAVWLFAAVVAGAAIFRLLGFAFDQYAAVALLGMVLAAMLAWNARGPRPPARP